MKKYLLIILVVVAMVVPFRFASAEEVIHAFDVTATLSSDRMYRVTETIHYDFGDAEKHGIFRFIPIVYLHNGLKYDFHPRVVSVYMDGHTEMYDESRQSGQLQIKIGDPNETITGAHQYAITYETDRAVNFFPDHSEMYWNVTGNQWPVTIEQSSYALTLPAEAAAATIQTACFTGPVNSIEKACKATQSGTTVTIKTTRVLLPEDGFTIVIGIPEGIIRAPTSWEKVLMTIRDNGIFALPFVALIVMLALWFRTGRDPKLGTVIPIYEPPQKMSPAELAAVMEDGMVPKCAVTATIIDLAKRGYLHIRSEEKKHLIGTSIQFTLLKKKEADAGLKDDEREIFDGLFASGDEVTPEGLAAKHEFYKNVQAASEVVWKRLSPQGLFIGRPSTTRATYIGGGILVGMLLGWVFGSQPYGVLMAVVTATVIIVIGWFMPRRTQKGADLYAEVKGFEWFMSVTEKDRLDFHDAPERTSGQFQELLPYAIALAVEKKWAKQFEGITMSQPEWAEGSGWSTMNAVAFTSHMNAFATSATSMTAPPGSSGFSGGSSGGGGGGGGGGSW